MNMKMVLVLALALVVLPTISLASTLSCSQVDGMAIFGYDWNEWIHIGAIGNEFNSLSIANDFGAGNEFKSTSIFNEFGRYGGEFGSNSAFNDFASNPPIIINDDYKFVGYLTTGYKTPSINTYEAIACANNSYRSPNRDMEDITFKSIPSSSSYSGGGYVPAAITNSCPANSSSTGSGCVCNSGYVADGSVCISATQSCQKKYGSQSYGDDSYCYCNEGYQFNADKTYCYAKPTPTCPTHSKFVSNTCTCDAGYVLSKNGQCLTPTDDCYVSFGAHVVGTAGPIGAGSNCSCASGYQWNGDRTACVAVQVQFPVAAQSVAAAPSLSLSLAKVFITTTLKKGMEGEEVLSLQRILATDSSVYPEGLVTGYFGPATERAVRAFQKKYGLEQVGFVGPKTRALLNQQ